MSKIQDLKIWIDELVFPGEAKEFVHVTTDVDKLFKCSIYTDEHVYHIVASENVKDTYLGCQAAARKERPGETWKRGNELSDGPLELNTWVRILGDIVKYELLRLSEFRKPNISPE